MRKNSFWDRAAKSLPAPVRQRYLGEFERAERWELALDAAIEAGSRVKAALARAFQTPRRAPH